MPFEIEPVGEGRYRVINAESGSVHARHATLENAKKQVRLLYGLEHGMKPGVYGSKRDSVKKHFHKEGSE